jgi:hypothetical protein
MEKVYSEKQVEESLELEPLIKEGRYKKTKPYSSEQINEPFVFVRYSKNEKDETGEILISSNVEDVSESKVDKKVRQGLIKSFLMKIENFYTSLCGFNNYYYQIPRYFFTRPCCDETLSDEIMNKKRRKFFEEKMGFIEKYQTPGRFKVRSIATISNCGEILTEPNDMGWDTRHIHWIH